MRVFCCKSFVQVCRDATAADLLRYISLFAVAGAMRCCGAGETCGTVYIFLPCVGCSCVQGCTAVRFLCCASFSAVAAQCALWVRGWKTFCSIEWKKHFAFLQRTTSLQQPSAPRSAMLPLDQFLQYSNYPHSKEKKGRLTSLHQFNL